MRTTKKKRPPKRPESRSLKIQARHRYNQWSTSIVPEIKLCGNWLEKIGFTIDSRVTIHASKELIVIQLQEQED
ncbi:SymE family type I addiction module toxin [Fulvivirgaceae bacterium BMA12]|uniref:SymE family type I addiction module toxin n=1 Tax=Agaribacillus aureus TaxID=3051825 RepID=A0ABT8L7X9_9BACT|nr:SymE family type I addiction module toxin [Fulvivirgaceae bacterium BMA12]